ncbi:hypothetical protein ABENE_10850 [Asticcacaulis benevestitus DSM 16100 = ATCC BAA-896]|uniref:Uncharacterized protein n=1 Tax=Asticcacaulis benevestitus DSM 16100 = ATCC BAA-896 TaxID=1121022 RepID=V4RIK6_9CAUL|nr:hypothetical protein ABENE_10850 [Asticcacaulis benevestitus DSM 16100 = ATCC BAA-896]
MMMAPQKHEGNVSFLMVTSETVASPAKRAMKAAAQERVPI